MRQIESWWILVCPSCGGLVQPAAAICTHVGDCPRRHTRFVARKVEVAPADCEWSEMVAYHTERYDRLRTELEALRAENGVLRGLGLPAANMDDWLEMKAEADRLREGLEYIAKRWAHGNGAGPYAQKVLDNCASDEETR